MGIDGPMKYRKLRIAWSVMWGIATVLFVTLWAGSYRGPGTGYLPVPGVCCRSAEGILLLTKLGEPEPPEPPNTKYRIILTYSDPWAGKTFDIAPSHKWAGFYFRFWKTSYYYMQAPYWFLVGVSVVFSVAPWRRHFQWRFTLRTLLIATTLVAVVLGLIAWAIR